MTGDYIVETLPEDRALTYNDSHNFQDLANYSILVLPEPSSKITADEAKAVYEFVKDGGGLLSSPTMRAQTAMAMATTPCARSTKCSRPCQTPHPKNPIRSASMSFRIR